MTSKWTIYLFFTHERICYLNLTAACQTKAKRKKNTGIIGKKLIEFIFKENTLEYSIEFGATY